MGLFCLRARYYRPEVGRFVSRDRWPGDSRLPATLQRFVYVANNPLAAPDPTGYCAQGGSACRDLWRDINQEFQDVFWVDSGPPCIYFWEKPWEVDDLQQVQDALGCIASSFVSRERMKAKTAPYGPVGIKKRRFFPFDAKGQYLPLFRSMYFRQEVFDGQPDPTRYDFILWAIAHETGHAIADANRGDLEDFRVSLTGRCIAGGSICLPNVWWLPYNPGWENIVGTKEPGDIPPGHYVPARENAEEDFAESFAFAVFSKSRRRIMDCHREMKALLEAVLILLAVTGCGSNGEPQKLDILQPSPCAPPCWQNITPGKTGMDEALESLRSSPWVNPDWINVISFGSPFSTEIRFGGRIQGTVYITEGVVESISIPTHISPLQRNGVDESLELEDLIRLYGPPLVYLVAVGGSSRMGLILYLHYPQHGWYMEVRFEAPPDSDPVVPSSVHLSQVEYVSPDDYWQVIDWWPECTIPWNGYRESSYYCKVPCMTPEEIRINCPPSPEGFPPP